MHLALAFSFKIIHLLNLCVGARNKNFYSVHTYDELKNQAAHYLPRSCLLIK